MLKLNFTLLAMLLAITMTIAGCGKPDTAPAPQTPDTPDAAPDTPDAAPADSGDDASAEDPKIAEALAKLSPADQEAAKKQKTCPVSGALLGSMGTPVKLTVKGQDVFLCCKGCEGAIKEDPDKYLAKLPKQ